ncbi:MAG: response regulator transcription factor [Anaerolineae bacterium]|nr:response regulator transcription factor [Anaerolineae bacterium]
MNQKFLILVVDDQEEALDMLSIMLEGQGFEVVTSKDAISGLRAAFRYHPDAILLDVMMPEVDGFEACRRLREMTATPIIFVTAKGTIEDVMEGFSAGADDYIIKPYNKNELLVRLWACLRRAKRNEDRSDGIIIPQGIRGMLDRDRHELIINGRSVYLTPKEFEVMHYLISHIGKVLQPDAILNYVWGGERIGDPDLIKQYIYRLRQKIETDPDNPRYLHTVWGEGYYFDAIDVEEV